MCGRFTLRTPADLVAEVFRLSTLPELSPHYNIAPTQQVAVVRHDPVRADRELGFMKWGLVPSWADDPSIGNRLINARSETAASKASFRQAFKQRRCLVIADGFFEWRKGGRIKEPYYISMKDDRPFGFAGLWEHWEREGRAIDSCTILTTDANELMQPIHDRMPAIISPESYDLWLNPEVHEVAQLQPLLHPCDPAAMQAIPVSTLVNNVRNESAMCVEPVSHQRRLFE